MPEARTVSTSRVDASTLLTCAGQLVSRYGLVVVLAWIGFGKYVKMEARVLIEHSPLMSWIYHFLSVGAVATALGTAEILAAVLIALRPLSPTISAVGSAMAVVLFSGTVSFLFTTPGLAVGISPVSRFSARSQVSSCSRTWCCWRCSVDTRRITERAPISGRL